LVLSRVELSEPAQRAQAEGYADCLVAENIAFASDSRGFSGPALADRLFAGWLNSAPHRRNMLDGELTEVGIAAAYSERSQRHYAVQLFGRPRAQALRFALTNGTGNVVRYELGGRRYELSTTPLRDRGGRVTGRLVVLRDVTERHLAHERLLRLDEQRRWLLGRVVWAQEEERRRIAGEVHDDAIQTIAAARLLLTTFRGQLTDDRQRRLLDHLEEAVSSSLARLRTLVFDLRPAQLDDDGLAAALREYLAEAAGQGGFTAELRDDIEQEPPAEVRVIAYRICQEALTNVRVHARAGRVEVRLEEARGGLLVSVADDGEGFDERARANGEDELSEGGLGIAIIRAIADEFELGTKTGGRGSRLRFVKLLPPSPTR
jgi:signal transduction histidine kinase